MVKNLIRLFLLIVRKKMGSTVTKVFTLSIVIGITIIFLNTYYYSLREAFILNRAQANKTIFPNSMVSRFIKLCVLIRVHRAHLSYLPVIAFALSHSGFDKIQLYVINIDKNMNSLLLSRVIDSIDYSLRMSKKVQHRWQNHSPTPFKKSRLVVKFSKLKDIDTLWI